MVWPPAVDSRHPLANVPHWFTRWLADSSEVDWVTVKAGGDLAAAVTSGIQGVIISGSPRDAWVDDPINASMSAVVRRCQERGIPLLGVCYGHQILARVLGAAVGRHPDGLELGNTLIELTEAGQASPLFAGFPQQVEVLSSHADAVLEWPAELELLARGSFTACQAFQWRRLLYGVQFHPETDPEVLRFLWAPRRSTWRTRVKFDLDAVLDNLRPTPLAATLLNNFVQRIVL